MVYLVEVGCGFCLFRVSPPIDGVVPRLLWGLAIGAAVELRQLVRALVVQAFALGVGELLASLAAHDGLARARLDHAVIAGLVAAVAGHFLRPQAVTLGFTCSS
jgi:hypothetical protein